MCKKIISTILCMVMLLSVIGVSAATETKESGMIVYTDNFNHDISAATTGVYPTATYTSDVFAVNSTYTDVTLTPGAGPDGSVAAVGTAPSNAKRMLRTKALEVGTTYDDSTKWYELSFDLKINAAPTTLYIGSSSENRHLFSMTTAGDIEVPTWGATGQYPTEDSGKDYALNTWYHVVVLANGDRFTGWIYDDNGLCVTSYIDHGKSTTYIDAFFGPKKSGHNVTIDNAKLVEYVRDTVAPSLVSVPSIADSTAVSKDIESITVKMDQPIDVANSTATLNGTSLNIAEVATAPHTYTLTGLPNLQPGTQYTLDLSGLKNLSGVSVDTLEEAGTLPDEGYTYTYTFTTETGIVLPEFVSSSIADGATGISRTVGSMTVTFNSGVTQAPETVTLTGGGVDIIADVSEPDNGTYTFTWDETLAINVPYTVDLSEFGDGTSFVTDSITFTTANDFIAAADGFETVVASTSQGYNVNGADTSIPLTTGAGKSRLKGYVKTEANGYTGAALNLTTGGTGKYECVLPLHTVNAYARSSQANATTGATEYEQLIVTYRINFKNTISSTYGQTVAYSTETNNTDRGARIRLGAVAGAADYDRDNALAVVSSDATKTYIDAETYATSARTELDNDRWYNVVYAIDGTEQTFTLIDAVDGSVVWSHKKEYTEARPVHFAAGEALTIYPINLQRHQTADYSLYNSELSVLLDDFSIWSIKPWENDHALAVNSVEESGGTFAMTFNQPVMGKKNMLAVALNENRNDDIAFNAAFTYPDFCSQTVTLSALPKSADLNLDYSGLKGISGSKIAESVNSLIGFETGIDAEFNAAFVGDAKVSGSNVTFNLYGSAATSPKVYVAFYNEGKLVNVVPKDDVTLTAGAKTAVTVAAPEACDTVKVFAWNANLQPQMLNHNQALVIQPAVSE